MKSLKSTEKKSVYVIDATHRRWLERKKYVETICRITFTSKVSKNCYVFNSEKKIVYTVTVQPSHQPTYLH